MRRSTATSMGEGRREAAPGDDRGIGPDPIWIGGRGRDEGVRGRGVGSVRVSGWSEDMGSGRLGRWSTGPACWAEAQWGGPSLFPFFCFAFSFYFSFLFYV